MFLIFIFILLAPGVQDCILTNPRGAQALGKEFFVSTPRVIQEAIKFPQFHGPKGVNARMPVRTQDIRVLLLVLEFAKMPQPLVSIWFPS